MSLYEIDRPDSAVNGAKEAVTGIAERLSRGVKAGQNAQILRALSRMDDATLDQIGISRRDIPTYARFCIYDK